MVIPIKTRRIIAAQRRHFLQPSMKIASIVLGAILAITVGRAYSEDRQDDASRQYRIERAHCLSGHSNEDQKTCLQEAGAAQEERRRGQLEGNNTQYEKNSMLRCQALDLTNRDDCERR